MLQQARKLLLIPDALFRQHQKDQPLAMAVEIGKIEMAFSLGGAAAAKGDEFRQPPVGGSIDGISQQASPAAKVETAADDEGHAYFLGPVMGAHHAGEAVVIRHGNRAIPQLCRPICQLVGMRCAAEK